MAIRNWRLRPALAGLLLAVLAVLVTGVAEGKPRKAAQKRRPAGEKKETKGATRELWGIDWHTTLEKGLAASIEVTGGSSRPVMLFRVLGDLDGLM